jgi:insulysin
MRLVDLTLGFWRKWQVDELAKSKLEKAKRLGQQASWDWAEIKMGTLRFDRPEAEVAALRLLTPSHLLSFFEVRLPAGLSPL